MANLIPDFNICIIRILCLVILKNVGGKRKTTQIGQPALSVNGVIA